MYAGAWAASRTLQNFRQKLEQPHAIVSASMHQINRQILKSFLLAAMVILVLPTATHAQQSGQSLPETGVPQVAPGGIFPDQADLQSQGSSTDLDLGGKGDISIPNGRPASADNTDAPKETSNGNSLLLWISAVLGAMTIFWALVVRRSASPKRLSPQKQVETEMPLPVAEPKSTPTKKPKNKKKKHRKHT